MQNLIKILFFGSFSLMIISCKSFNGKIEKREYCDANFEKSQKLYLVNKSTNKTFRFTIRQTEIINNSLKEYSTELLTLEPGDEVYLGCEESIGVQKYNKVKIPVIIDTVVLENTPKYYTLDTSIIGYDYYPDFFYKSYIYRFYEVKIAAYKRGIPIKDYVDRYKLYMEIPTNLIVDFSDSEIKRINDTLIISLIDYSAPLNRDKINFEYKITGEMQIPYSKME